MGIGQTATAALTGSGIPAAIVGAIVVIALLVAFAAVALGQILIVRRRLRRASRHGRDVSVQLPSGDMPLTTFNREGRAGDPINMQIVATSGQLGASFAAAGWYRADEIDLVTSARISADSVQR